MVNNGISLCRLHHAAFDRHFLGLTPDFRIQVRADLLDEEDGPTLLHGIQGLHGVEITLPRRRHDRPDVELVRARFRLFQAEAAKAS
ncbi:MAG: HNH endonuclease [Myxococcota bacterium]